jgi:hypothetical protein
MSEDIQQRLRENETFRNAIINWLTANGINIRNVPEDAKASIADGKLTIPLYVANERGEHQIDPDNELQVLRRSVTVPVKVPPTPDVDLWLAPICPTCGR